jgi:CTP-dependent riboflavin kinase
MVLSGTLRLSDPQKRTVGRTAGRFNVLVNDNAQALRRHFGVELFPGSLNVDVRHPASLQQDLDAGRPAPSIVIPRTELVNMPAYLGAGQAWPCKVSGHKFPEPILCWIFRRIGSKVPAGVIEIVAQPPGLRSTYGLQHGDAVTIELV